MKTINAIKLTLAIIAVAYTSFGGEYEEAKARYNNLCKQVKQKESEISAMRRSNPACIIIDRTKTFTNLTKKYPTRDQSKYYTGQITYVRSAFYCTKCKIDHAYAGNTEGSTDYTYSRHSIRESAPCKISKMLSWKSWVSHLENIEKTKECNVKIDALLEELSALREDMLKAKKEMNAAYYAKRKAGAK